MRPALRPDPRPADVRPQDVRPPLRPLTDEEGEVRELTAEDFAHMRPIAEVDPGMVEAVAEWRNKGGRPKAEAPKEHISFRLAANLVASIKATGPGYNARVEKALRAAFIEPPEKRTVRHSPTISAGTARHRPMK
jgi:uncharacterized protein (DUF4415 family)